MPKLVTAVVVAAAVAASALTEEALDGGIGRRHWTEALDGLGSLSPRR